MTLRYWLHHEEEVVHATVLQHLQTAGVVLITLAILIGLYLGAVAALGLHELNP
jgi:hypothetical protein